ncbi:hypothetical protein PS943_04713 [Pseudomonas fluorescens]|uniref:Uncharacterized protein n=1 Tax=Pseudomonas fluorescens TaxID=294 RepID=A0A5E7WNM5_PSEFL|nr:hypothetical protein PS943_04713 [Pseudomonas fluorescens]
MLRCKSIALQRLNSPPRPQDLLWISLREMHPRVVIHKLFQTLVERPTHRVLVDSGVVSELHRKKRLGELPRLIGHGLDLTERYRVHKPLAVAQEQGSQKGWLITDTITITITINRIGQYQSPEKIRSISRKAG